MGATTSKLNVIKSTFCSRMHENENICVNHVWVIRGFKFLGTIDLNIIAMVCVSFYYALSNISIYTNDSFVLVHDWLN